MPVVKMILLSGLICIPALTQAGCRIYVARGVHFGVYNPLRKQAEKSTGKLVIRCHRGHHRPWYKISLSKGQSRGYRPRQMRNSAGGRPLVYNLYTNPSHGQIWGDGSQGTSWVGSRNGHHYNQVHVIHARIPPKQTNLKAGQYRDQIIVTVDF